MNSAREDTKSIFFKSNLTKSFIFFQINVLRLGHAQKFKGWRSTSLLILSFT